MTVAGPDAHASQAAISHPPQFPLVDAHHYSHNSWYKFWSFPWQPQDWTQPVDYYRGHTYFRYEIRNLREPAMLQFCYFQDRHVSEKHACGPQWVFEQPGVYYRRFRNSTLWQRQVIDWTRPLLDFMLIDNRSEGRARTSVEVSIIVVADGERLEVPDHWQCPTDWNCIGGVTPAPAPQNPEPEEPAPQNPEPEEPAPQNPEPEEPAPQNPEPEEPAPGGSAPADPGTEETAPSAPARPRPDGGTSSPDADVEIGADTESEHKAPPHSSQAQHGCSLGGGPLRPNGSLLLLGLPVGWVALRRRLRGSNVTSR
jgi:hypothetical protein